MRDDNTTVAACRGSVIHDGRDARNISAVALVSTVDLDMAAVSHRSLPRTHRWAGFSALAAVGLFTVANALWALAAARSECLRPRARRVLRRSLDQNRGRWAPQPHLHRGVRRLPRAGFGVS